MRTRDDMGLVLALVCPAPAFLLEVTVGLHLSSALCMPKLELSPPLVERLSAITLSMRSARLRGCTAVTQIACPAFQLVVAFATAHTAAPILHPCMDLTCTTCNTPLQVPGGSQGHQRRPPLGRSLSGISLCNILDRYCHCYCQQQQSACRSWAPAQRPCCLRCSCCC